MTSRWSTEEEPILDGDEAPKPWIQNRKDNKDFQLREQLAKQIVNEQKRKRTRGYRHFIEKVPGVFEIQ